LRLIESGRSDFWTVNKDGNKNRVGAGSTFPQIELKKYLLSLPDKTLLSGKKDIIKVLRGYIDRGQLNWTLNERSSNLKDGTVKKQVMSITVRLFPAVEQENRRVILPLRAPQPQQYIDRSDEQLAEIHEQLPPAPEQTQLPPNVPKKPNIKKYVPPAMRHYT